MPEPTGIYIDIECLERNCLVVVRKWPQSSLCSYNVLLEGKLL